MSMHLLPAFFTTTNMKKRNGKKKKTDDAKHQKFLEKMGVSPKQIKEKRRGDLDWPSAYNKTMRVEEAPYASAGISGSSDFCVKRGVLANLHKEPKKVQKEILEKASRVQPLYNKGGLQYVTDGIDLHDVGKKK